MVSSTSQQRKVHAYSDHRRPKVTLYGSDSEQFDTCSSTLTVLAEIARCYNSSWVYYSIDECLPPHSTTYPSSTPTFPSTSTPTSTDEPDHYDDNDSQDDKPVLSTAAIVGIAVGGFVALVTLNALAWFLVARRRRKRLGFGAGPGDSYSHSYGPVSRIPPEGMPPKYGGAPGYLDPSVGEVSEMQSPVPEMVGSPPHQPQELPGSSAAAVGIARGGPEVDLGDAHVHDDAEIEYEEEVEDHEEEVSTWESQQHEHQRQLYDQHWRPSPLDGGSQGHSIEMRPVYR